MPVTRVIIHSRPESVDIDSIREKLRPNLGEKYQVVSFQPEEGIYYKSVSTASGTHLIPVTIVKVEYEITA